MQVVALKSFFGTTGNTRIGDVLDVADKLGKAWVDAGLVRLATNEDAEPAPATTPPTVTEPTGDEVDTTKTDEPSGDQPDVEADKEPVTGNTDEPTARRNNNSKNAKKESK